MQDTSEETKSLLPQTPQRHRPLVGYIAIIGLAAGLVGGVAGDVYVAPWYKEKVLRQEAAKGPGGERIILDEESAIISAVEKVNPSVVSIVITKDLPKLEQFGFFFVPTGETEKQQVGAGSGFIVNADGLVVTNKHVISDTQAEYTVITKDGQKYPAKVLDVDPFNDLGVVKIEGAGLPPVTLGDSDNLKLGQRVIAIGNALGQFQNSVTTGVVSGIGRDITASGATTQTEKLSQVIQTDAAINPGNSGGPLINLSGEVIGVNTAVSQEGQLIGFAIPINQVKKVISDVQKFGKIRRPFLGVRYMIVTDSVAEANKLPVDYGALIVRGDGTQPAVVPGSPAFQAGLAEGDIILEIDGKKITADSQLGDLLRGYDVGSRVILKVRKKDGGEKTLSVTLGEAQ